MLCMEKPFCNVRSIDCLRGVFNFGGDYLISVSIHMPSTCLLLRVACMVTRDERDRKVQV